MATRYVLVAPALLAGWLLAACGDDQAMNTEAAGNGVEDTPPEMATEPEPAVTPEARAKMDAATAAAIAAFGFDLYAAMPRTDGENLIVSPPSIATALGMLLAGTVDQAADELLTGLHLPDADTAAAGLAELAAALRGRSETDGITLSIANRSFVQEDFPVRLEYLSALARYYDDAMMTLDFAGDPDGARETINQWVAERTNDLIPQLLAPGTVDALTRLMLVNTIYLLADWSEQFDETHTGDEPFHLADGTQIEVPTMHDTRTVPVSVGDGYRALELEYVGEEMAMLVVVPDDLEAFEQTLDAARIEAIVDDLAPREIELWLPKVETRSNANLNRVLTALGMERIFIPDGGWLTGIADDPSLYVSDVIHETYLRMDEEGTEAAAATAIGIRTTSLPPPPMEFRVDRPYFIALRDRPTGTILFMGRIVDPR